MSKETIEIDKMFLQKTAEFIKLVATEIKSLKSQLNRHLQKEASDESNKDKYIQAVTKVAHALYNSDMEFLAGDFNHKKFIKLASEDPSYLARTFEKVCNASDIALVGKPARVTAIRKQASNDPVYAQAFGHQKLIDDNIVDWDD